VLRLRQPRGGPVGPKQDWQQRSRILRDAGIDHRRVHDARHTAATFMLVLGVESRVAMATMGWSSMAMIQRYQHVVPQLRDEVATRMEALLFRPQDDRRAGR
jgi:integrase